MLESSLFKYIIRFCSALFCVLWVWSANAQEERIICGTIEISKTDAVYDTILRIKDYPSSALPEIGDDICLVNTKFNESLTYQAWERAWYANQSFEASSKIISGMDTSLVRYVPKAIVEISRDFYVKDMSYWFYQMARLKKIEGLENLKTDSVKSFLCMFDYCMSLSSLDLSSWEHLSSAAQDCKFMFRGCYSLKNLKLPKLKLASTALYQMLYNARSLERLDLSPISFKTDMLSSSDKAFYSAKNLKYINLGDFGEDASSRKSMFEDNSSLMYIFVDKADFEFANAIDNSIFKGCVNLKAQKFGQAENLAYSSENIGSNMGKVAEKGGYFTYKKNILHISTMPNSLKFTRYDDLDLTGGKLSWSFVYGKNDTLQWETVDLASKEVKITGYDHTKLGKQLLEIEYKNLKTTLEIELVSTLDIAPQTTSTEISVYTKGSLIMVDVPLGSQVELYTVNGSLIKKQEAINRPMNLEAPNAGIYIVKVGDYTKKIVLN